MNTKIPHRGGHRHGLVFTISGAAAIVALAVLPTAASASSPTPSPSPGLAPSVGQSPAVDTPSAPVQTCTRYLPLVAAAGFDPLTASAAQLRDQDFPAPPTDPAMLKAWQGYVRMYKAGQAQIAEPCTPADVPPSTGIYNSSTWAGNVANGHTYTEVEGSWVVPRSTGSTNALSSHWVGLGLGNSQAYPLVQEGVEAPAVGDSYAWVETYYPGDPVHEVKISGFSAIENDSIYVHVHFATNSVSTHIINYTTGVNAYPTPQNYSGMTPDGHAEWISEDPNGEGQPLANFGQLKFTQANAQYDSTGWKTLGSLGHYYLNMTEGSDLLAYPGSIDSTGQIFTNYWVAAS